MAEREQKEEIGRLFSGRKQVRQGDGYSVVTPRLERMLRTRSGSRTGKRDRVKPAHPPISPMPPRHLPAD